MAVVKLLIMRPAVANLQLHAFAWFRVKVKSLSTSVSLMITLD